MDKAQAYAVLRIEPGCTEEEIKKAYAALSRQYHPEEYPEEFQQIHDAYRMLRRQEQRQHTIHPVTVTGTKEADSQSADINALEETEKLIRKQVPACLQNRNWKNKQKIQSNRKLFHSMILMK